MKNEFDFGEFDCFDKHKMNEEIQEKIKKRNANGWNLVSTNINDQDDLQVYYLFWEKEIY